MNFVVITFRANFVRLSGVSAEALTPVRFDSANKCDTFGSLTGLFILTSVVLVVCLQLELRSNTLHAILSWDKSFIANTAIVLLIKDSD